MELTLKSFANQIEIWESHVQSFWEQELVLYQLNTPGKCTICHTPFATNNENR